MKNILVPFDFSKPAINAFRTALDTAKKSKGKVHLLNVIELPVLHDSVITPVLNFEQEFLNDLRAKSESEFSKILAKYNTVGIKVVFEIVLGTVSKTIIDYIRINTIDVVFMGSHGASGFREFFIGSNAEKIVRKSSVPVLIIKDYYKGSVKNIVFPNTLDTQKQEDLVVKIKALQNFFKAHLNIVWINTPINFASDTITLQRLEDFAKRYRLKDYSVHVFNHFDEEEGILQFTGYIKGDLIAMGTHGRTGIAHIINGSLSEDVANHADKLVWTYPLKNEPVVALSE